MAPVSAYYVLSDTRTRGTFTWEAKWTQTGMRFHLGWKSHFGVESALYLYSHELRQNEAQNGMDFISVILTEMNFQTGLRFSCEHNLPETKWISAGSMDVAFNAHVRLKLMRVGISYFERNEISIRVIKYHVNTTRNEIPLYVHQYIGLFWNAASCEQNLFSHRCEVSEWYEFISWTSHVNVL